MIDVILDAEVLKRDPSRRKGPFRALIALFASDMIKLHIPEVAAKEYLTHQHDFVRNISAKALQSIKQFHRLPLQQEKLAELSKFEDLAREIEAESIKNIDGNFKDWCTSNNVEIPSVESTHGSQVIKAYFSGDPPFKSRKNRSDIPDAFIWMAIRDICEKAKKVALISGDKKLVASCESGPNNLECFQSIEEFLTKSGLGITLTHGVLESQIEKIVNVLQTEFIINTRVLDLMTEELLGRKVTVFYPLEGAYEIASVNKIRRPTMEGLITYYGDGLLSASFTAIAECDLQLMTTREILGHYSTESFESIRSTSDETIEVTISRHHVFGGLFLFAIDKYTIERECKFDKLKNQLLKSDFVLESIGVFPGTDENIVSADSFSKHAHLDALKQIEDGNLNYDIDPKEEEDRKNRKKWFDLPEEMAGKYGDITIKEGAQVEIAPFPRFENWVKVLKKNIIEETGKNSS